MLVLSRRLQEKIVFPGIKATVKVVAIKSGVVRLGIEAPPEVTVLREEVPDRNSEWGSVRSLPDHGAAEKVLAQLQHVLRNRLNVSNIGLALLRRQLEKGLTQEALATVIRLQEDFQALQQRLEKDRETAGVAAGS